MSVRKSEFRKLCLIGGLVLLFFAMALFAAGAVSAAQPAEEELLNESVNVTDHPNESVYLSLEFADTGSVDSTLTDPSGNTSDPELITGSDGSISTKTYNATVNGTYRVSVIGDPAMVTEGWASTDANATNGSGVIVGGSPGGDDGLGLPVPWWAVALIGLVVSVVAGAVIGVAD